MAGATRRLDSGLGRQGRQHGLAELAGEIGSRCSGSVPISDSVTPTPAAWIMLAASRTSFGAARPWRRVRPSRRGSARADHRRGPTGGIRTAVHGGVQVRVLQAEPHVEVPTFAEVVDRVLEAWTVTLGDEVRIEPGQDRVQEPVHVAVERQVRRPTGTGRARGRGSSCLRRCGRRRPHGHVERRAPGSGRRCGRPRVSAAGRLQVATVAATLTATARPGPPLPQDTCRQVPSRGGTRPRPPHPAFRATQARSLVSPKGAMGPERYRADSGRRHRNGQPLACGACGLPSCLPHDDWCSAPSWLRPREHGRWIERRPKASSCSPTRHETRRKP